MPPPLPVQLPVGSKTMTEHPGFKLREKWRGVVHEPAAAPRRSEGGGRSWATFAAREAASRCTPRRASR